MKPGGFHGGCRVRMSRKQTFTVTHLENYGYVMFDLLVHEIKYSVCYSVTRILS